MQQWKWDEGACTVTPVGAMLQLQGHSAVWSLAAAPGPDGVLQLLAGCADGTLRVLVQPTGGALQQQAELAMRSGSAYVVAVMMP